jgi:hypothetical protein
MRKGLEARKLDARQRRLNPPRRATRADIQPQYDSSYLRGGQGTAGQAGQVFNGAKVSQGKNPPGSEGYNF